MSRFFDPIAQAWVDHDFQFGRRKPSEHEGWTVVHSYGVDELGRVDPPEHGLADGMIIGTDWGKPGGDMTAYFAYNVTEDTFQMELVLDMVEQATAAAAARIDANDVPACSLPNEYLGWNLSDNDVIMCGGPVVGGNSWPDTRGAVDNAPALRAALGPGDLVANAGFGVKMGAGTRTLAWSWSLSGYNIDSRGEVNVESGGTIDSAGVFRPYIDSRRLP